MRKGILGTLFMMVMILSTAISAFAADVPAIEVRIDGDDYTSGDVVAAKMYIKNAVFNTAGVAFHYDTSIMTPVLEDGSDADSGAKLVSLENAYEKGGYFSTTTKRVDKEAGVVYAAVNISSYMIETKNKSVTADENGLHFATVYFRILSNDKPVINLTTIDGQGDFGDRSFFIYDNGIQDAAATASTVVADQMESESEDKDEEMKMEGITSETESRTDEGTSAAAVPEGELVTVEVKITGSEFNTAGFALAYNPEVVKPVGELTYDDTIYTVLRNGAADGIAHGVLYVTPGGDAPVVDSKDGVVIASMTFRMKKEADPEFDLVEINDDIDFADTPFFALNNGSMNQDTEVELLINGVSQEKMAASDLDSEFVEDVEKEDSSIFIPIAVVAAIAIAAAAIYCAKRRNASK